MRQSLLTVLLLAWAPLLPAQIVINEFNYDGPGTAPDGQFVELYNAGAATVDMSGWIVENRDWFSPAGGSPITIPAGTMLLPGAFYVIGDPTVANVNLAAPNPGGEGWLEDALEGIVLRNAAGDVLDAVGYEMNKAYPGCFNSTGLGLSNYYREGTGVWGNHQSQSATATSLSRYLDGYDTNDNGADFGELPMTPGTSNNMASLLPYADNFDATPVGTSVAGWHGSFVLPAVVDPTVPGPAFPNALPPSPQGGNAMVAWDPAGGGNAVFLTTTPTQDLEFQAQVYLFVGHLAGESEQWSIGVRGNTGSFYNAGACNGNTGICWTYRTTSTGGSLSLVDEGSGDANETVLAGPFPVVAGMNDGWQPLTLSVSGCNITATYMDQTGVLQVVLATAQTGGIGQLYIGYREAVPGTTNARPFVLDDLQVFTPAPSAPLYQPNQAGAKLDIDGVQGDICNPALTQVCVNGSFTLNVDATPLQTGLPWDMGITFQPLVASNAGGIPLPLGQVININLGNPAIPVVWLNGGLAPNFVTSAFPGTFSATIPSGPTPLTIAAQIGVVDPNNPLGISLSQGAQLDVIASTSMVLPVLGDDGSVMIPLNGAAPLCVPPIPFYGTLYPRLHVQCNGRVMFGEAQGSASPSVLGGLGAFPFVGAWADMSPQLVGASITASVTPAGDLRIDYVNVPYFGTALNSTFGIVLSPATGAITIDGIGGIGSGASLNMFLGISKGNLGATDPGAAAFGPAPASGTTSNATDMIYQFGFVGTLASGVSSITFTPNMAGNYDWASL